MGAADSEAETKKEVRQTAANKEAGEGGAAQHELKKGGDRGVSSWRHRKFMKGEGRRH